jgi:ribonuclease T2
MSKIIKSKLRKYVYLRFIYSLGLIMTKIIQFLLAVVVSAYCGVAQSAPLAEGQFDFYVLSLSWTPSFCLSDKARAGEECEGGGKTQFVVHGLWPQNEHGFPSNCPLMTQMPSQLARDATRDLYPAVGLAIHEWKAHGACTGLSPADYISAVREAKAHVVIPALFNMKQSVNVAPTDVVAAFAGANQGLRAGMAAVMCPRNQLSEVRVCLTKDLRGFRDCPDVVRASCHAPEISVPAGQ